MRAHRPFWHVLAAIMQVAALLALSIAIPAHARAHALGAAAEHVHAHVHADHAHAVPAGIDGASAAIAEAASDTSQPAGSDSHSGQCCGLHCHFPLSFVGVAEITVPLRWNTERAFRRPRDATFASVVPEALPEPPRSFA